jgi:hypothetical protein
MLCALFSTLLYPCGVFRIKKQHQAFLLYFIMKKSRTNISYSCVLLFIVITFSSNGRVQKINIKQLKRKKLQKCGKNCRKMYFKFHWKYGNEIVKHFKGKHDSKTYCSIINPVSICFNLNFCELKRVI